MFLSTRDPFLEFFNIPHPFASLDLSYKFINKAAYPIRQKTDSNGTNIIEFDVPGMNKKDLQLHYLDNVLFVQTISKKKTEESTHSRFVSYRIRIPDLDIESIEATCKNGILTVVTKLKIPKQTTIAIK